MQELTKHDWKLFQEKIGEWQERYMAILTEEYINLLQSDEPASKKFWTLDERMKKDKKKPGVQLMLRKSESFWDLVALYNDNAITLEDLVEFSEMLREGIITATKR